MDHSLMERLRDLTLQFPPFVIAVVFHEFGHGLIARFWGDHTAEREGRLTLNPIAHVDPLGTILLPLISMGSGIPVLFGWAKPVPIDPTKFRKYRPGLFWVSAAGPGMNFLLATVSAAIFCAIRKWMPETFYLYTPLIAMAGVSVQINYWLGIFNLIPLPPLDGSKIVEVFLPYELSRKYEAIAQYSTWIFIGLIMSGVLSFLSYPIRFFTETTIYVMAVIFRLPEVVGL